MTKAKTKTLYILIRNGGDGSYSTQYTFNKNWIDKLSEKCDAGDPDTEDYWDGDGFHYDTLEVPVSCTPESMGFSDSGEDEDD